MQGSNATEFSRNGVKHMIFPNKMNVLNCILEGSDRDATLTEVKSLREVEARELMYG